jgi:hypothetical protein
MVRGIEELERWAVDVEIREPGNMTGEASCLVKEYFL